MIAWPRLQYRSYNKKHTWNNGAHFLVFVESYICECIGKIDQFF